MSFFSPTLFGFCILWSLLKCSAESCSEGDNGTVRLENLTSGRVLVCWEGEWRGLADGAIRTTQQAKDICHQLAFLQEGVEILEALEGSINYPNIYCPWSTSVVREKDFGNNCSNATTPSQYGSNKTTAIECKTQSAFTPELIALTTAVPVLLCVILVGAVVIVLLTMKLNVQKTTTVKGEPHQVFTRRCVAYEAAQEFDRDENSQSFHMSSQTFHTSGSKFPESEQQGGVTFSAAAESHSQSKGATKSTGDDGNSKIEVHPVLRELPGVKEQKKPAFPDTLTSSCVPILQKAHSTPQNVQLFMSSSLRAGADAVVPSPSTEKTPLAIGREYMEIESSGRKVNNNNNADIQQSINVSYGFGYTPRSAPLDTLQICEAKNARKQVTSDGSLSINEQVTSSGSLSINDSEGYVKV